MGVVSWRPVASSILWYTWSLNHLMALNFHYTHIHTTCSELFINVCLPALMQFVWACSISTSTRSHWGTMIKAEHRQSNTTITGCVKAASTGQCWGRNVNSHSRWSKVFLRGGCSSWPPTTTCASTFRCLSVTNVTVQGFLDKNACCALNWGPGCW